MRALGICIGATSVSAVILDKTYNEIKIESARNIVHNGSPREVLEEIFSRNIPDRICVTGKKFRSFLNLSSISEAEAIELAADHLQITSDLIISAGGENFIVYVMKDGKISRVSTGNKCASGTGEFFMQQIKRMDLSLNEAAGYGLKGEPYNISGRCSVFCKSDCTHALNKGVAKENVVSGLARMMAQKIIELTSRLPRKRALLIGGTSRNKAMVRFLKEHFDDIRIPEEAPYFEALGASVHALHNDVKKLNHKELYRDEHSSFTFHKPLSEFLHLVHFREFDIQKPIEGDDCILGLDVGSTTTKAVLLRKKDSAVVASEYLRTNGDPVKASVECYRSIKKQLEVNVNITGIGVTGSGRHIAGLHALTPGIINEIIAHAAATVYFDREADTIFEIGGQDAKYTFITSGVASDYAMNEACSAGTGSFLEEAAKESLGIDFRQIGELALKSNRAPNFNDQCAAFISSDIKNALHEGLSREDILAGLVYSVCMNYNNRVKGNRPSGSRIFMQGGVCYNKAVPVAMAALTGKEIIVPPEPGLMGAFGVALEIRHRMELGLVEDGIYSLDELIDRTVEYGKEFTCGGGQSGCDRKCRIAVLKIDGKRYPFGGACDMYYNILSEKKTEDKESDYVKLRQKLVFEKYIHPSELKEGALTVGILKSFFTNTLYPLYYNFFNKLGFRVILADDPLSEGIEKREAAFCYPVELAHGFLQDLINRKPDYIFLPHIYKMPAMENNIPGKACVLVQSESYYLKSTFRESLQPFEVLSPLLDFSGGYNDARQAFISMAAQMGKEVREAASAFDFALNELQSMLGEFKSLGTKFLNQLEKDPERIAVVLFGRAYNAFAGEANLGIPKKFSSRGVSVIPHDFLPYDEEESYRHMYWASGQQMMKGAHFVKKHPQLFGAIITNFSCGPDSFILGYFRKEMGRKPSLTLELDSHSADAGINTRIEAALDIFRSYRQLKELKARNAAVTVPLTDEAEKPFVPLRLKGETKVVTESGEEIQITDRRIKLLIPSMGQISSRAFAAAFKYHGINAEPLPVYTNDILTLGRGNSSCKECLPLQLNAGSMIDYYSRRQDPDEITLYFMAKGDGPCRLGQYFIFLEDLIEKRRMKNFGIYTLSDEDSYEGLGNRFVIRGWAALTISGVMKDIYNTLLALAADTQKALSIFEEEYVKILEKIEKEPLKEIYRQLEQSALRLKKIEKKTSLREAKKIVLVGEIFVRHDEFSRMDLIDRLVKNGFVVKGVPITEYVYYSNYLAARQRGKKLSAIGDRLKFRLRDEIQKNIEKKIKRALAKSELVEYELIEVKKVLKNAEHLVSPDLEGEAVLSVGSALKEVLHHACGVIALGPFGCMPSRVAESILNVEMNMEGKARAAGLKVDNLPAGLDDLPFLAVETDGNLFPQIIQSKIEIFMLQAARLHETLKNAGSHKKESYSEAFEKLILKHASAKPRARTSKEYESVPEEGVPTEAE